MTEGNRVIKVAGLIMVAMVISRVLGYLRDVAIFTLFGQNRFTDAYNAAFSIPDFLYMLLVGGALSSAFIPVFSGYLARGERREAWDVASTIFNAIMALMAVGIALGLIFTPQLVHLLVPGFSAQFSELTVQLTRMMFIQAFFMALSGISMGILNSFQEFLAPAVGSVLYNLGIILIGLLLAPWLGVTAFSLGVVIGAVANFVVQIPPLLRLGLTYRPIINLAHPGVVRIGQLILPVLIGLSVIQFNLFINQNLASDLSAGVLAALRSAQRLMQVPIGIFAVAVSVAVFPTLTGQAALGEIKEFRRSLSLGVGSVVFFTLPAAAGLIALKEPIIRFLFQQGEFTAANTHLTAELLLYYSLGLAPYAVIQVLNRAYYALQDTKTPVIAGLATMAMNLVLNFALVGPLAQNGLALAYSLAGVFNMLILLEVLRRRLGRMDGRRLFGSFLRSLLASLAVGMVSFATATYVGEAVGVAGKQGQALQVGAAVLAGVIVYAGFTLSLGMEEARMAWQLLASRLPRFVQR